MNLPMMTWLYCLSEIKIQAEISANAELQDQTLAVMDSLIAATAQPVLRHGSPGGLGNCRRTQSIASFSPVKNRLLLLTQRRHNFSETFQACFQIFNNVVCQHIGVGQIIKVCQRFIF